MAEETGWSVLKLRVRAAATEGAANAAVAALVAKTLKVRKSAVCIVAGDTARLKRLEIGGLDMAHMDAAFGKPG